MNSKPLLIRKTLGAFLIMMVFLQMSGYAQTHDSSRAPVSVGVSYRQIVPRGDFRENTRGAEWQNQAGLGFDMIFHLRPAVNLRLDYFFGEYDKNSCTYDCPQFSLRGGGIGGELVLPRGPVRPYVTGGVGRISFSGFDDTNGSEADTGAGYTMYGVGVKIQDDTTAWSIDLAWRRHKAGPVSYRYALRSPEGSISVGSVRTQAPFDMFVAGLHYRFGRRSLQ